MKVNEYRPCTITEERKSRKRDEKIIERKGIFRGWFEYKTVVGESYMACGHSAGQVSALYGIIEYEDGTVHYHSPEEIRFTDRKATLAQQIAKE